MSEATECNVIDQILELLRSALISTDAAEIAASTVAANRLLTELQRKMEKMATMTLSHIRRPLRRARGNQWYRDKGDRSTGTWCGAPDTRDDIQEAVAQGGLDHALEWINRGYGPHEICPKCIAIRSGRKP